MKYCIYRKFLGESHGRIEFLEVFSDGSKEFAWYERKKAY